MKAISLMSENLDICCQASLRCTDIGLNTAATFPVLRMGFATATCSPNLRNQCRMSAQDRNNTILICMHELKRNCGAKSKPVVENASPQHSLKSKEKNKTNCLQLPASAPALNLEEITTTIKWVVTRPDILPKRFDFPQCFACGGNCTRWRP